MVQFKALYHDKWSRILCLHSKTTYIALIMIFTNIDIFESAYFYFWSVQAVLYYLWLYFKRTFRMDFIFILVSIKVHQIWWNKFKPLFYAMIAIEMGSIVGIIIFIPVSLNGCIDIRDNTIEMFGINRTQTLLFSHYKLTKLGDEKTKNKRNEDSDIILSNGTFSSRVNTILINMIESNRDIKGILENDWTIDVLNNSVKNG